MRTGPISPIACERVERRDDVRLPAAWVRTNAATTPAQSTTHLFQSDPGEPVRVTPGAPVLVMLPAEHAPAMAELLTPGSTGERVYVLSPAGWELAKLDPQLLACRTVLIRRVPEVPAAGVYRASGALLWLGATAGGKAPWGLRLDAEQAESFRQVFLRLFWHHAIDEGWTGGKQLSFRAAAARPFDVPELPRAAPVRLLGPEATLAAEPHGALVHLSDGAPPKGPPRRLWFPASGSHHQHLARLVREGAEVVWDRLDLPDLVVGPAGGTVLLPGARGRLRIELNAAQTADATRILLGTPGWRFGTELRLGDYAASGPLLWLDGAPGARAIEAEQAIDLPIVQSAQIRTTPETPPDCWPPAQPLALAARYRWTAVPPRLPQGADEDPLVGRWRHVDQDWSARLSALRQALQSTDSHRGRLAQAFSRLLRATLGFERTQKNLLAETAALQAQLPSAAGPAGAPGCLQRLTSLEDLVRQLQGEQEDAERKAREDEARERQEQEWRGRVAAAQRELPERRAELTRETARLPDLEGELATIDSDLKAADKKAKKDLQARQSRVADELSALHHGLKRLRGQVADLEQRAAETFHFTPPANPALRPAAGAGRFVPPKAPARATSGIPEEALPEVGALCRHGGQRYLVIEAWEELLRGEQTASRLKARLVAPESR